MLLKDVGCSRTFVVALTFVAESLLIVSLRPSHLYSRLPFDTCWKLACAMGRPVFGLWTLTYRLDRNPDHPLANILLRWLQGGFHVLTATLIPTNGTSEEPTTVALARLDTSATDNPKGFDATKA